MASNNLAEDGVSPAGHKQNKDLRMPRCAANFPPSPAVPSEIIISLIPLNSAPSLARILPP
jgi:hypothetical protein